MASLLHSYVPAWRYTMLRGTRGKVIPLRQRDVVADGDAAAELEALQAGSPRPFPSVSTMPHLLLKIPDEILDYFGWVFCQGGFVNLHMTFEQFLAVVAMVSPATLCPDYEAVELGSARGPDDL
jgi:hypothetical protein